MKRKLLLTLTFIIAFGGGIGLGWYMRNQTINPTATLPNVFERILTLLVKKGEQADEDLLYHDVGLTDFIMNGSNYTKVAVKGTVNQITHEPDGDYHIVIRPQYAPTGLFLVTETIPEIQDFSLPKEGDYIKIWGITRFDEPHNWRELHPVIGWEKL